MVFFDLLLMTKKKILVLIALMLLFSRSYLNLGCLISEEAVCEFLILEFFVTFVWMFVIACTMVEVAKFIHKKRDK
jgi:hypothetical protein